MHTCHSTSGRAAPVDSMRDDESVSMVDTRHARLLRQGPEGVSPIGRETVPAPLALARALIAVLQPSAAESSFGESFAHAMASVEAELGLLVSVRAEEP